MKEWKQELLERIQSDFPTIPTPYARLAEEFGVKEEKIIKAIKEMRDSGVIRRIGASIDSRKAGYVSTLVGCKVEEDALEAVAEGIGYNHGVTHSYQRDDEFNLWFTLIMKDEDELKQTLGDYSDLPGVVELHSMPADKVYKIKVQFATGGK